MPNKKKKTIPLTNIQRKLVENNIKLAESMAYKFWIKTGGNKETFKQQDLNSQAYIGLCLAAKKWEESRGPFSAYARLIIKHELGDAHRNSLSLIAVPEMNESHLRAIREAVKQGFNTIDEVSDFVNLSRKKVIELWSYQHHGYIEIEGEKIEVSTQDTPEMQAINEETKYEIAQATQLLPNHLKKVIELRFGFTNGSMHTTQEISKKLRIKIETVRQRESEAMEIIEAELKKLQS